MDRGQRIRVNGTSWAGTIVSTLDDGRLSVLLENGIEMFVSPEQVTPISKDDTNAMRYADGKFKKGHPAYKGKKRNRIREGREAIYEQIEPFLKDLGTIIEDIDAPEDKILAISRILPYSMPKLATVEFKEREKRNLSAEESIAKLNAAYNHLPDPTEEEEHEEE